MASKTNTRNQGLDLLRIICMLMVICLHYFGHGGLVEGALPLWTGNWFSAQLIVGFCHVCVNCFILISGYFLCTSQFRLKKWVSIWLETIFYSVSIYLILVATGLLPFSVKELAKSFMVLTMSRYWFVAAYLLLLIVSPFLNYAIQHMDQRAHASCCCVALLVFSILPTFFYVVDFAFINRGSSMLSFCGLYLIASYIRKYVPENSVLKKKAAVVYILCILLMVGERALSYWITPSVFGSAKLTSVFYPYASPINIIASVSFFFLFHGLPVRSSRFSSAITFFAPVSFAAYLIHEQKDLRPILWEFFTPYAYVDAWYMVFHMVICVAGIFIVCCIIEHLRQWVFRITKLDKGILRFCNFASERGRRFLDRQMAHPQPKQKG